VGGDIHFVCRDQGGLCSFAAHYRSITPIDQPLARLAHFDSERELTFPQCMGSIQIRRLTHNPQLQGECTLEYIHTAHARISKSSATICHHERQQWEFDEKELPACEAIGDCEQKTRCMDASE